MATLHMLSHSPFADSRLASCLREHKDTLGKPCKDAYYGFLKARFEAACSADYKKNCPSHKGNPMLCLREHADKLSDNCKDVVGLKPATAAAGAAPAAAPAK